MASKKLLCFLIVYFFALGSATYCNDDSDCYNSESCCSDKVCRQKCYYCSYDYQCGTNEQCCNNKCTSSSSTSSCSYDYQCQISEQCCNSKCISSSSSCTCSYDYQCGSSKKCCNGKCISSLSSCSCSYDYQCGSSKKCCNSKCIGSSSSCYCTYDSDCDIGEDCCGGVCSSSYCGWSGGAIAGAIIGTIIFFAIIISIVSCLCCACCPYYRYRTPSTVVVTGQQPQQQMVSTHTHLTTQQVHPPPPVNYNQPPPEKGDSGHLYHFSRLNIVFLEMWFHLTTILNRCDCIWPSLCFHRQFSIYFRLWNFQDGECRSCRITVNLGYRISRLKFFCIVLVRMTSNVALESNVVGECVRQTVVWAAELLQVLSSAILSSSPSSFALYPTSAVLPARTGQVLRCLKQVNMETTGN